MLPPCYQCGTVYQGNKCPECATRAKDIQGGFLIYGVSVVGGSFSMISAIHKYPPLWLNWFDFYGLLILIFVPVIVMFVLQAQDQLERRVVFFGLLLVLGGTVLPLRAGFIFLNGALDKTPPLRFQSVISDAHIENREDGPRYVLGTYVTWNHAQIYQDFFVSRDIYFFTHPGDSIQLALYGGAFSLPWAGRVDLSNGQRDFRFKFSPRM
jgi:hypothetical protein